MDMLYSCSSESKLDYIRNSGIKWSKSSFPMTRYAVVPTLLGGKKPIWGDEVLLGGFTEFYSALRKMSGGLCAPSSPTSTYPSYPRVTADWYSGQWHLATNLEGGRRTRHINLISLLARPTGLNLTQITVAVFLDISKDGDSTGLKLELIYVRKMKSSRPSLQLMRNSGKAAIGKGTGQELVSPPHWDKAFLIAVHGSMDCD
jgi:hypothetical protein